MRGGEPGNVSKSGGRIAVSDCGGHKLDWEAPVASAEQPVGKHRREETWKEMLNACAGGMCLFCV